MGLANQSIATTYANATATMTLYEKSSRMFWRWNGRIWQPLGGDDLTDDLADWCDKNVQGAKAFTMSTYRDISEQCRRKFRAAGRQVFSLDDVYVSFTDCLLNPDTMETVPHSPDMIATTHIEHPYSDLGNVQMPIFQKYLDDSCFDHEKNEVDTGMMAQLQEIAGYLLSPTIATKAFILYGDGGTGKSVFLEILRCLVSEDRCLADSIADMTTKDFSLPSLIGKKANIQDEEKPGSLDVAKLKQIIDGKPMTTRKLYGDKFTFRPRIKLYFGSQEFPRMDGFDNAIRRRFLIITFDNIIPKEKKILYLDRKIIKAGELPAIVKWALDGLKRLVGNNFEFTETPKSERSMSEFRAANSSVAQYIEDSWVSDPGIFTPFSFLYNAYSEWCSVNHRKPVSSIRFGREATGLIGQSKTRHGVRGYEVSRRVVSPLSQEQATF
jgi:putative DNA primase/helicase